MSRRWLAAFALIAVVAGAWWALHAWGRGPTPWGSINVDDQQVTVTYVGSECRSGAELSLDESSTRVVVTVYETVRARSCSDVGVSYDVRGRLSSPLNGREIVDGACLKEPWKSRPACRAKR